MNTLNYPLYTSFISEIEVIDLTAKKLGINPYSNEYANIILFINSLHEHESDGYGVKYVETISKELYNYSLGFISKMCVFNHFEEMVEQEDLPNLSKIVTYEIVTTLLELYIQNEHKQ